MSISIILSISPGFTKTSLTNIISVPCSGNLMLLYNEVTFKKYVGSEARRDGLMVLIKQTGIIKFREIVSIHTIGSRAEGLGSNISGILI